MRKKLLTVALAATMAVTSVFSAFAETKDFSVTDAFATNSGNEQLTGDFNVTYKFHCKGYQSDTKDTWETFAVELTNAGVGSVVGGTDASYLTAVVGNQNQWWFNDSGASSKWDGTFTSSYSDADKSLSVLADADVECTVVRSGEKITITATCTGTAGKADYSLEVTNTAGFGDTVNLHITGEDCEVSGISFTNNAGATTPDPTEAPTEKKDDTATATTASTEKKDDVKPAKTGDVSSVAVAAIVALGAAVAVVASKKKVTE